MAYFSQQLINAITLGGGYGQKGHVKLQPNDSENVRSTVPYDQALAERRNRLPAKGDLKWLTSLKVSPLPLWSSASR